MGTIKIALTNLGQYNEGLLNFTWLELPATEEEIAEAMKKIDIGAKSPGGGVYEEWFITDYECDFMQIGEYDNIDELNEIAEALEDLNDDEAIIVKALLDYNYELQEALDRKDDCRLWDTTDMSDIAYDYYYECYAPNNNIPDFIERYIDFDAMGRDMSIEGTFLEYDGYTIEVY